MSREFEPYQRIERSIITKYKKEIWNPFTHAVRFRREIRLQSVSPVERIPC